MRQERRKESTYRTRKMKQRVHGWPSIRGHGLLKSCLHDQDQNDACRRPRLPGQAVDSGQPKIRWKVLIRQQSQNDHLEVLCRPVTAVVRWTTVAIRAHGNEPLGWRFEAAKANEMRAV